MQHRGLGDTIAMITKSTGVSRLAKAVAKAAGKEDCECEKRQKNLNEKFPYKRRK